MHTEDGFLYYGEIEILSFQVLTEKYEKYSLELENKNVFFSAINFWV
jgi:hypothetical protein